DSGGRDSGGGDSGGGDSPDRSDAASADRLEVGPPARLAMVLARWRWWQAIGPRGRATVTACAALTAVGLALGVARVVNTPHVVEVTRRIETRVPQGADALGCPAGRTCLVNEMAGFTLPGVVPFRVARVIAATDTADASGTSVYRRELVLITNGPAGVLRVVSQCRPDAQPGRGAGPTELHNVDPATGTAFLELTYRVLHDRQCSTLVQFSGPDHIPTATVDRIRHALPRLAAGPPLRAHL
ncbi:MAG: hypothetical protein ABJA87_11300, partial [bacterium]